MIRIIIWNGSVALGARGGGRMDQAFISMAKFCMNVERILSAGSLLANASMMPQADLNSAKALAVSELRPVHALWMLMQSCMI